LQDTVKLYEERCRARALQIETRRLEKCKTLRLLQTEIITSVLALMMTATLNASFNT